jgi:L-ascorbate metabolism protein UlaG (beta-lactamase superfamily)
MTDIRVTHVGGPTVLIEVGGWRLLTDPTFDPRRQVLLRPGPRRASSASLPYRSSAGASSRKLREPALSIIRA